MSLFLKTGIIKESVLITTNSEAVQKTLSHSFLQEVQTKTFEYDRNKYKEYLELISQKKKWYGLGEDKLMELFPCFSLLVEKYNDKMFAKRSKWERDLMKDGKLESMSMIETKGRMVTSAGQFFYCCKRLHCPLKRLCYKIFLIVKLEFTFNFLKNSIRVCKCISWISEDSGFHLCFKREENQLHQWNCWVPNCIWWQIT
jgi:hypothetical protein